MAKMRSPNYPAHGLQACIDWTERIWEREGRTALSPESAAIAAGYKGLSGPSRTVLASLKKFGLLEDSSAGVRISPLALEILHPSESESRKKAIQEAALTPGLFSQLFQTHGQASIQSITAHLITKMGFSQIGARACAEAFKESLHFAGLDESPSNSRAPEETPTSSSESSPHLETRATVTSTNTLLSAPQFRWPLTEGKVAEIAISRGDFTEADLELLCAYLQLAKRSIISNRTVGSDSAGDPSKSRRPED